ncbi:MAG: hypothetical protein WDN28_21095 [Chthoniobacter sp.]
MIEIVAHAFVDFIVKIVELTGIAERLVGVGPGDMVETHMPKPSLARLTSEIVAQLGAKKQLVGNGARQTDAKNVLPVVRQTGAEDVVSGVRFKAHVLTFRDDADGRSLSQPWQPPISLIVPEILVIGPEP